MRVCGDNWDFIKVTKFYEEGFYQGGSFGDLLLSSMRKKEIGL